MFLRYHWFDVLITIPYFRFLRALRVLRAARAVKVAKVVKVAKGGKAVKSTKTSPWIVKKVLKIIKALKIMDKIGLAKYKPNEGVVIVKKIKKLSGDMLDYLLEKIIKQEFEEKKRRPKVKKQTRITNFFKLW